MFRFPFFAILAVTIVAIPSLISAQKNEAVPTRFRQNPQDARNTTTGEAPPPRDPEFEQYALFENTAPRAAETAPVATTLPLDLQPGERIAFIGNGLLEQSQWAGYFESFLHQRYPEHQLVIRNFCWSADTPDLQPRPENFADLDQHLTHYKIDVIFASYGFNESFAGEPGLPKFREALSRHLSMLKRKAFNGKTGPRIVLLSPIANENVERVPAGQLNNESLRLYTDAMREVANEQQVGFVDLFSPTLEAIAQADKPLTKNGVHLNDRGYETFARAVYRQTFGEDASAVNEQLREAIVDKNRQFFRRYRPVNTFYYTGGRNKDYGYLDFLPAMKNFELMVESREERIWNVAQGQNVPEQPDDSQLPELPPTVQSRGANEWLSAEEELKAFQVDPRFEVTLFAGEEEFPELAAPIQMRWDSRGRLWVSCSTTYPHVYPGNEPNDKIIILEDT
ncbi:MAG: hypothetical protein KDA80_02680, partial [Planctomycetaceae bacterium]|nr:hypothetical protein [Planctomycetaceae bacterium]